MIQLKWISLILLLFNGITILFFAYPPVVTDHVNRGTVLIYLMVGLVLIALGLKNGYKKAMIRHVSGFKINITKKFISLILPFYIITLPIKYGFSLGIPPYDILGIITRISIGIANPSLGYYLNSVAVATIPWSIYFIVNAVGQFFFTIYFCRWQYLSRTYKISVLVLVVIEIFFWFGIGTSFGVVMLVTNFLFSYIISSKLDKRVNKLSHKKIIIFLLAGIMGSMYVFSRNIVGRTGGGDSATTLAEVSRTYTINENNIIVANLPDDALGTYIYSYAYLCQGYEHLGLAFNCEFTWTRFVGSCKSLMYLSEWLLKYDPMKDSYMDELEKRYKVDPLVNWHSAYTWMANDFTFIGALISFYIIAFLCGYSLFLSVNYNDLVSMIVCVVFANTILFIFANTNYLTNCFNSFMFVFPYWIFTRYKK